MSVFRTSKTYLLLWYTQLVWKRNSRWCWVFFVHFLSITSLWHSSGDFWCRLSCVDCENVLWHLSHLNGFSPVCVRMWLFSVVAPANERPQKPHLNGFSLMWITTCSLSSAGPGNDEGQCPHWYGRSGDWKRETNLLCLNGWCVKKKGCKLSRSIGCKGLWLCSET